MLTEEEVTVVTNAKGEMTMISPKIAQPEKITKEFFLKNLIPLDQITDFGDFLFDED